MIESYAYEIFRQDALESARKEVMKERLEQGLEQGRQEGRQEGAVLKMRHAILNALRVRFQDVPPTIQVFIESVEQESTLDLIFEKAIITPSMHEFEGFIHNMRS